MGLKVESLIFQISTEADRSDEERALAGEDIVPIMIFANGPENAFLVGARTKDLDAAFDAARERAEGLGAERLAIRMRVFEAAAYAIETDMKYVADPGEFPNAVVLLMVEALYQYGVDNAAQMGACAVRYARDTMQEPDFELAPAPAADADGPVDV
ncbi:MAG: hypothetical protein NW200_01180 [Hyphomonadaceae bacterium]|nr:hypothetical protein [Hyphomonadaceae bacterium]